MKIEIDTGIDMNMATIMGIVSKAISLQVAIKIKSYTQVKIGTFILTIKCISKDYIIITIDKQTKIERRKI